MFNRGKRVKKTISCVLVGITTALVFSFMVSTHPFAAETAQITTELDDNYSVIEIDGEELAAFAAKYDDVAQSFQQTVSIFKGGAKAIGDGILVSNGVSQLNMLDEYINSTGKVAESETEELDFEDDFDMGDSSTDFMDSETEEMTEDFMEEDLEESVPEIEE